MPLTCARTGSNMSRSGGAGIPAYLSLQERLEVNQLENEEKTKQLAFLASKYKELERRVRITEGENRTLRRELEDSKNSHGVSIQDLNDALRAKEELEEEINRINVGISNSQYKVQQATQQWKDGSVRLQSLEKELRDTKESMARAKDKARSYREELHAFMQQHREKIENIAQTEMQIADLSSELAEIKAKMMHYQKLSLKNHKLYERAQDECRHLQGGLQDAEKKVHYAKAETELAKKKVISAQDQAKEARKQSKELRHHNTLMKRELEAMAAEERQRETLLFQVREENAELRREMEAMRDVIHRINTANMQQNLHQTRGQEFPPARPQDEPSTATSTADVQRERSHADEEDPSPSSPYSTPLDLPLQESLFLIHDRTHRAIRSSWPHPSAAPPPPPQPPQPSRQSVNCSFVRATSSSEGTNSVLIPTILDVSQAVGEAATTGADLPEQGTMEQHLLNVSASLSRSVWGIQQPPPPSEQESSLYFSEGRPPSWHTQQESLRRHAREMLSGLFARAPPPLV